MPVDLYASGPVGAGAFAGVRVTTRADGQRVAIKTYEARLVAQQPGLRMHMENELRLVGKLDHPHVIAPSAVRRCAGYTEVEIGEVLGLTERTVRRDWDKARLLLLALLRQS